jgi:hypothetical protein
LPSTLPSKQRQAINSLKGMGGRNLFRPSIPLAN